MDEIDELPPPPRLDDEPLHLLTASEPMAAGELLATMAAAEQALRFALGALEIPDLARATPAQRGDVVRLRGELEAIKRAVDMRLSHIDYAFKRLMEDSQATELPIPGFKPMRYERGQGKWQVRADALLDALKQLIPSGKITKDDLEAAFTTEITLKVDNRRLNGLAKRRGEEVELLIKEHREYVAAAPLSGRLSYGKEEA